MRSVSHGQARKIGEPPRARTWRRRAVIVLMAYAAIVVVFNVVLAAVTVTTRMLGHDPRRGDLASVHNLRVVDDRLWAGAQPDAEGYRQLAERGVTAVVDLRTGASDDRNEVDPQLFRHLGLQYVSLPVRDGHAPSRTTITEVLRTVGETDGIVYLHCGGGVGRSAATQAGYLAERGGRPRWTDLAAIGPMTLEQLWFVAAVEHGDGHAANPAVRRVSEVLDAPRRLISRVRGWL